MELNISNPPATQVPLTAAMIGLYTGKRCRTAWIASSLSREESGYFRLHPASPRRSAHLAARCQDPGVCQVIGRRFGVFVGRLSTGWS